MNWLRSFLLGTFGFTRFITNKGKKFKDDTIESLIKLKKALNEENEETKKMLETYYRFTVKDASKNEMAEANEQFRSMLKTIGLSFLVVLPFAPLTIPFIVKVGQHLGIDVLPNSFSKNNGAKDPGQRGQD